MTATERTDLVDAVLASREELDPGLDAELLVAIVDAEATAAGDGDAAIRTIDAAVTAAIARGVGAEEAAAARSDAGDGDEDELDEEDEI